MISKKLISLSAVTVLALSIGGGLIANASTLGNKNSGHVVISDSQTTPFAVVNVGGGKWDYGTSVGFSGKKCWSNYQHQSKTHSSTAQVGSAKSFSGWKSKGVESKASIVGSILQTGEAFWNTK
ncbi:MAG: lactococcin 972 family bacteriocin [Clostridium sp.]